MATPGVPNTADAIMADSTDSVLSPPETHGTSQRLPVTVSKAIPPTFDLGNLLVNDPSPLPSSPTEAQLASTARDAAQSLINQLLTACAVTKSADGVALALPAASTPLPREKAVPAAKEQTKWERFAARKGIKAKRRDDRRNVVFDEERQEWVPRWGYKGKNKDGEGDWLVEVDEKKEARTGEAGDARKENRAERMERARRNERRQRANERRAGKGG